MTRQQMFAQEGARKRYKGNSDVAIAARNGYIVGHKEGYEQAEKDVIALIESRIGEILGDAQPKPILRLELRDLIKRIK